MSSNKQSPRMSPRLLSSENEQSETPQPTISKEQSVIKSIMNLNSLYKNLDSRLQRLETVFADQLILLNSNTNNYNKADSSSTSSSATLANTDHAICNSSTGSASICSLLEHSSQKEVSRADLDDFCLHLLQKKASPSIGELNSIVMNLKKLKYPDLDVKFILSKVREWFRRKREYMSQRIMNTCTKRFSSLHNENDPDEIQKMSSEIRSNPIYISEIIREANLEIVDEASAYEFCNEKVSIYLDNLINDFNYKHNSAGS